MFSKSIFDLEFGDIEEFCKKCYPEGLIIDYKENFPKNLAKTVASFANTFGGYILIGIETNTDKNPKIPIKGIPYEENFEERIRQISLAGIHQPLYPEIKCCKDEKSNICVVVIYVPPSLDAPHVDLKTNRIPYRVGDITDPIRDADIDRIEYLLKRREEPRKNRASIINRADQRMKHKIKKFIAGPPFPYQPICSAERTFEIINNSKTNMIYGDCAPILEGSQIYDANRMLYAEFNQKGILILYTKLWTDKRTTGKDNTISIGVTISDLLHFIKFICECYSKVNFNGLIELSVSLENCSGYSFFDDTNAISQSLPESYTYTIKDPLINVSKLVTISNLIDNRINTIYPVLKDFFWACGLKVEEKSFKKTIADILKHID